MPVIALGCDDTWVTVNHVEEWNSTNESSNDIICTTIFYIDLR